MTCILQEMQSRGPSIPQTPSSADSKSAPAPFTLELPQDQAVLKGASEASRAARERMLQNQRARENFLLGKDEDEEEAPRQEDVIGT